MGLFKKVGKAFHKGVKSLGKAAKGVFKSNIFKLAGSALSFVPGLNAVGLIGKGLSMLGKASNMQTFLKTGLKAFSGISKNLGQAVKHLASGLTNPLGNLTKLPLLKGLNKPADFIKLLKPDTALFQQLLPLTKQLQQAPGLKLPLPNEWNKIARQLAQGGASNDFLRQTASPAARLQGTAAMFQELLKHLETHSTGAQKIIRA